MGGCQGSSGSGHLVADEVFKCGGIQFAVGVAEGAILGEGVEVLQGQPHWKALQALPPTPVKAKRVSKQPRGGGPWRGRQIGGRAADEGGDHSVEREQGGSNTVKGAGGG